MKELTHISLFAGIGGIDLAAKWAGFRTILFVEIDPFCRKVLRKRWSDVPIIEDIRDATKEAIMAYTESREPGEPKARNGGQDTSRGSEETTLARDTKGNRGQKVKGVSQGENPNARGVCGYATRGYGNTSQPTVTLVTGGFPCQPVSVAGKRRGKDDDRWLWPEMLRVISEVRPAWVVAENVAGLLNMGEPFGESRVESKILTRTEREDYFNKIYTRQERMLVRTVLGDLEGEKYETLCLVIPACAIYAPHRRDRIFIVAHTEQPGTWRECGKASDKGGETGEDGGESLRQRDGATCSGGVGSTGGDVTHSDGNGHDGQGQASVYERQKPQNSEQPGGRGSSPLVGSSEDVADTILRASGSSHRKGSNERGSNGKQNDGNSLGDDTGDSSKDAPDPEEQGLSVGIPYTRSSEERIPGPQQGDWWAAEPDVGRVADGVPDRVDRLRALGNAVVPQQIYPILKAIADIERAKWTGSARKSEAR